MATSADITLWKLHKASPLDRTTGSMVVERENQVSPGTGSFIGYLIPSGQP